MVVVLILGLVTKVVVSNMGAWIPESSLDSQANEFRFTETFQKPGHLIEPACKRFTNFVPNPDPVSPKKLDRRGRRRKGIGLVHQRDDSYAHCIRVL